MDYRRLQGIVIALCAAGVAGFFFMCMKSTWRIWYGNVAVAGESLPRASFDADVGAYRFPVPYDFSRMIRLMDEVQEVTRMVGTSGAMFQDSVLAEKFIAQINRLISDIAREKEFFQNFVWDVYSHSLQPLSRRQRKALLYYQEAMDRALIYLEKLKRRYSCS